MITARIRLALTALGMALLTASGASAQVFGTFSWQMQPYCNIVTLTITQIPGGYTIDGNDNQCGVGGKLAGAAGMALLNPDGTVGLEFTIVTAPSGKAVHVSASINPATGSGPWTDSIGNTGNFALGSPGSGSPRPFPASGLGAATVTAAELAPAAVGTSQLAPNAVTGAAVADGSLTMVDIANGPRLASDAVNANTLMTTTDTIYATATLTAPAAGRVLTSASGYFRFSNTAAAIEYGLCSITTGSSVDFTSLIISSDFASTSNDAYDHWGASRVFSVPAGAFTVRLVCRLTGAGGTEIGDRQLTALFVAQ